MINYLNQNEQQYATDILVARDTTDTLANKTLTTPVINGTITGTGQASANTVSTIVMRDASGNFSANVIIATTNAVAGRGLGIGGGTGDTPAILQFLNYAVNEQWSSISATNNLLTVSTPIASTSLTVTNDVSAATFTGSPTAATTSTGASGVGYMGLPQNTSLTGDIAVVASDAGKHIYSTATRTATIPANSNVAMPIGTTIVFVAATGATVTIAITSDTLILAGPGTTGSRTLAPFGMATAVKITSTSWIISGNGLT